MKLTPRRLSGLFVASLCLAPVTDGFKIWAVSELSSEKIFLQDSARITFIFDDKPTSYKALNTPQVANLHIDGPEISSSFYTQIINGKMSTKSVHKIVFTVTAEKEGRYTIPPITIEVDGQTIKGKKHSLEVLPAQKQDPFFQDFFGRLHSRSKRKRSIAKAKMFVTNPKPYVGQLFGAYYSIGTNIKRPRVLFSPKDGQPDLSGFYSRLLNVETMPPGPVIPGLKNPPVEGAAYNLIALKPGRLSLGAHTISVVDMERIFSDSGKVHIDPVEVDVQPLPEAGRPAGFGGTVGSFKCELIAENWPSRLDQWQEAQIDLVIEGQGNLHLLDPPQPEIKSMRLLESKKIRTELPELPMRPSGFVQIRYRFAAETSGLIQPGSITFHWFDPNLGQYQSSRHQIPRLDVMARPAKALDLTLPQEGGDYAWLVVLVTLAALLIAGAGFIRRLLQPGGRADKYMAKWNANRPAVRRSGAMKILGQLCGRKSGHLLERYLRDNGFSYSEIAHLSAMQKQRLQSEKGIAPFRPNRQDIELLKSIASKR